MKRMLLVLRMGLGGAVCGLVTGFLTGAFVGIVLGAIQSDWSFGLDAALLGGGIIGGLGALAGVVVGWLDDEAPQHESAPYVQVERIGPEEPAHVLAAPQTHWSEKAAS
jgi:hypothetical protein